MKNLLSAILLIMVLVVTSCTKDRVTGSGTVSTEDRNIKNFSKISLAGSANVTVVKGQEFNVRIKGYSNLLPYFETNVVNDTLEMSYDDHVNVRNDNTEVTVTLPALEGLSIAGSGHITSTGDFVNTNKDFETNIAGSGTINLQHGSTISFTASIMGSGDVNAFGFTAEKASIEISGSGAARITATNKLHVEIAGSGTVYYQGSPLVSTIIIGSGRVIKQ